MKVESGKLKIIIFNYLTLVILSAAKNPPPVVIANVGTGVPIAMLGIFLAGGAAASSADRGYSLTSLHLPLAALGSLPSTVRPPLSLRGAKRRGNLKMKVEN